MSNNFLPKFPLDAPSFKQLPKSIEAEDGDEVTLECEVDGNPLEIYWVYDPIDRVCLHLK